jgi:hypothetical protein
LLRINYDRIGNEIPHATSTTLSVD